jgi:hypothetical protein
VTGTLAFTRFVAPVDFLGRAHQGAPKRKKDGPAILCSHLRYSFGKLANLWKSPSANIETKAPKMTNRRLSILLVLALTVSSSMAQSAATPSPSEDCGKFVQQFYDWYLAKEKALVKDQSQESAFEVTLTEKASSFTPELVKALQDDLAASKKSADEVVGLDFDPFLNAQDTAEKYVVGEVHQKEDRYLVDVFGVWEGKKNPKPDVVPELALQNGKWILTNFHYEQTSTPENENLVSILRRLKEDREKPAK